MRGTKAKMLRNFARGVLEHARREGHEEYTQAPYLVNQNTKQIVCGGYRGIYRAVKRMYMRNEIVERSAPQNTQLLTKGETS